MNKGLEEPLRSAGEESDEKLLAITAYNEKNEHRKGTDGIRARLPIIAHKPRPDDVEIVSISGVRVTSWRAL